MNQTMDNSADMLDRSAAHSNFNCTLDVGQLRVPAFSTTPLRMRHAAPLNVTISPRDADEWNRMSDDERAELLARRRREASYKTAMCKEWNSAGECSYGAHCRFAHGVEELRLNTRPRGAQHPKYKTQLCDKYTQHGECPYGSRCMFIHSRDAHAKFNGRQIANSQQHQATFRPFGISNQTPAPGSRRDTAPLYHLWGGVPSSEEDTQENNDSTEQNDEFFLLPSLRGPTLGSGRYFNNYRHPQQRHDFNLSDFEERMDNIRIRNPRAATQQRYNYDGVGSPRQ